MTEALTTTTAGGRLISYAFGVMTQFQPKCISDRTLAGLEAARARGDHPPTMTPAPLCHACAMEVVATTIVEIADVLGVSRPTVYRHLEQEVRASSE